MNPRRSFLVAGAVVALIGAACSAPQEGGTAAGLPELGKVAVITDDSQLSFPFDAYTMTPKERTLVGNAVVLLADNCMRRFGFTRTTERGADPTGPRHARKFGISDPKSVSVWGYDAPIPPSSFASGKSSELSGAEMGVYFGRGQAVYKGIPVPADGCVGEANRELGIVHDLNKPGTLTERLSGRVSGAAEADPRLRAAFGQWSACIKKAGFHYPDPLRAINDPSWSVGTERTAQEIATATADLRCRVQDNLAGYWAAVLSAHQTRAIEQNRQALVADKKYWDARVRNAEAVLTRR